MLAPVFSFSIGFRVGGVATGGAEGGVLANGAASVGFVSAGLKLNAGAEA